MKKNTQGVWPWLHCLTVIALIPVTACHTDDGDMENDAATADDGGRDGGGKDQAASVKLDAGAVVDAANTGLTDASPLDQCYPPCVAKVRARCNVTADETSVCSKSGDETLICNSGGTRSRLFDEMMEGVRVGTTVRTLPDGKTICFSQSNRPGLEPIWLMRDGDGKTIAFQRGDNIVCTDDGKEYKVDPNSPACKAIVSPYMCKNPTPGACVWLGQK
ncbi:MAG: hypothetical protein KA712_00440 [Myxococcales bacterium]|nr:hypothetical protein [Myxococcales bacterium]